MRSSPAVVALLLLALGMPRPAAALAGQSVPPARSLDEWMPASPMAGLVPLLPAGVDAAGEEPVRFAAQLAATLPADRASLGLRLGAGPVVLSAVRELRSPVATSRPFVSGIGLAVETGLRPIARDSASPVRVGIVPEVNVATFDGAPHWLVGARVPVAVSGGSRRVRVRAMLAPAAAWGDVRPRGCTDTGPGDGCGDLGVKLAFGRTRWLAAGVLGVDHPASGIRAEVGAQRAVTPRQRTVFALALSWRASRRRCAIGACDAAPPRRPRLISP